MADKPADKRKSSKKTHSSEGHGELRGVKVLIADDEAITQRLLYHHLESVGMIPIVAGDGAEALRLIDEDVPVALIDLEMPEVNGLDCLKAIRVEWPDVQVLIVSGKGAIQDAVQAIKEGAQDYITKPFDPEDLLAHVKRAVVTARLQQENQGLREIISTVNASADFAAGTPRSKEVLRQAGKIAQVDSTALLTGESGTGKSTLARMIHQHSDRHSGPFVVVNCASLPRDLIEAELFGHAKGAFTGALADRPGRAEVADGGTLFLDEIGDLPLDLQPKLLTFLQDRTVQRIGSNKIIPVDVRVIVATHQDLSAMCADNRFREDLFFRLSVLTLEIPSLRNRLDDLRLLAEEVLRRIAERHHCEPPQIDVSAMERLKLHTWPGNVRELENVLERAIAFGEGGTIREADLRFYSTSRVPELHEEVASAPKSLAGKSLAKIEKQAILDTLEACNGNKAMAARELGITEKSIYNKMKRLEIFKRD